jgi:hypothetical protein
MDGDATPVRQALDLFGLFAENKGLKQGLETQAQIPAVGNSPFSINNDDHIVKRSHPWN